MKILIVEDDENIRELVTYALNASGFECTGYETAKEFFEALPSSNASLILLDIMLPDEDGLQIMQKIRLSHDSSHLPIILLTAKGSEYDRVKGLDSGADDYITKPFSILELISRIKAVLRRSAKPNLPKTFTCQAVCLDPEKHLVTVEGKPVDLTYKEFELLHFLLANKDIVLTREKIMNRVWGYDFEGESRTVDMHVKTLRQKLGASGALIKTVRGIGYKIGD